MVGVDDHYKSGGGASSIAPLNFGGMGDLAGITEIGVLDLGDAP